MKEEKFRDCLKLEDDRVRTAIHIILVVTVEVGAMVIRLMVIHQL